MFEEERDELLKHIEAEDDAEVRVCWKKTCNRSPGCSRSSRSWSRGMGTGRIGIRASEVFLRLRIPAGTKGGNPDHPMGADQPGWKREV